MADAYTVFWTQERCVTMRRIGGLGKPLEVLFGGPHSSEPSFLRAMVHPGDNLYPITVRAGVIYILGRTRVRRILSLEDYVAAYSDLFAPYVQEPPAWVFEPGRTPLTPGYVQALHAFDSFRPAHPELRYLAPTCTEEAVECEDGTPMRLDISVPPDMLLRLRYRSKRKERDLSKHILNGRLTQSLGVQGIYRLSESSAQDFAALVESAPVSESASA